MHGLDSQVCLLKSPGEWTREIGSSLFPEIAIQQFLCEGKVQPESDFKFTELFRTGKCNLLRNGV